MSDWRVARERGRHCYVAVDVSCMHEKVVGEKKWSVTDQVVGDRPNGRWTDHHRPNGVVGDRPSTTIDQMAWGPVKSVGKNQLPTYRYLST